MALCARLLSVAVIFNLNTLLCNCGLLNLYVYMFYKHILGDIVAIICNKKFQSHWVFLIIE